MSALLLFGFSLLLPDEPVLQVRFPPVVKPETRRNYTNWKAIEVLVEEKAQQ